MHAAALGGEASASDDAPGTYSPPRMKYGLARQKMQRRVGDSKREFLTQKAITTIANLKVSCTIHCALKVLYCDRAASV